MMPTEKLQSETIRSDLGIPVGQGILKRPLPVMRAADHLPEVLQPPHQH